MDNHAIPEHRLELRQAFKCGVAAYALVTRKGDLLFAGLVAFLVEQRLLDGDRRDFRIEQPACLSGSGALLADCGELVLVFARNTIALGDHLRRFQHQHIGIRISCDHCLGAVAEGRSMLVQGQRYRLHAARHRNIDLVADNRACCQGDGIETRGALAVKHEATDGIRQLRSVNRQAAKVVALGVPVIAAAEIEIIDPRRIDPGAVECSVHDMGGQDRRFGVVERAAIGLADAGAGGGNDGGFAHGILLRRISCWQGRRKPASR